MFQNQRLMEKIKANLARMDKMILFFVYSLVTISTIFVYSAARRQGIIMQNLIWIGFGTVLLIIVSFIDYREYKKYFWAIFGISVLLMGMVRLFGKKTLGAQRWLKIGPFQLQPSEFVKIAIIVLVAYWIMERYKGGIKNLKDIILSFLPAYPLMILILIQPDLGTTLIVTASLIFMIFLYGADMKPIWIMAAVALISAYPVYRYILDDYQKTRIVTFLNPEKDIRGSGYHVTQSKISIGAGGIFGKGVLKGSQSRLEFLPEPQTDFIFSVVSEEMGFIGSTIVLLLYFLLIIDILRISRLVHDTFGKLILYGICGIFFMHVIVNVGMTIGLVPVTGKPLLFLSYGGSSFLSSFIMIGMVESIKIHIE